MYTVRNYGDYTKNIYSTHPQTAVQVPLPVFVVTIIW